MTTPRISPFILAFIITFLGTPHPLAAAGNPVLLLSRGTVNEQNGPGVIAAAGSEFLALANPPAGVSLLAISAASQTNYLSDANWPGLVETSAEYSSAAAFALSYPAGTNYLVEWSTDGSKQISLALTDGIMPAPLSITNWDSAQQVVLGQNYTLAWTVAGANTDPVVVRIIRQGETVFASPLPGMAGGLTVASGAVLIPAATFSNTDNCEIRLTVIHVITTNTLAIAGTTALGGRHATTTFPLRMVDGTVPAPVILTTNIPAFPVGEAGFVPLQVTNGIRPMYFQVVSGSLPDGLALDSAGAITGTATAPGQSSLTIAVTDWLGRNSFQTLTLTRVQDSTSGARPQMLNVRRLGSAITFDISGAAATPYTVLSSTDLVHWATAMTTNAPVAQFPVSLPISGGTKFFRVQGPSVAGGMPLPPVAPIRITPVIDPTTSVSADVSPVGGSLQLTNVDGYRFTLTFPDGALAGPETITMTAVTSIGGLPLSGGLRAAVSLEPEGLEFSQPVRLDITSPVGFAATRTIGFGANSNGMEFALAPSFLTNDTVTLYLWHFTLGGVGEGTAGDAQTQAANGPDSPSDRYQQQVAASAAACKADPSCDIDGDAKLDELANELIGMFDNVVKPQLKQAVADDSVVMAAVVTFVEWRHSVELFSLDRPKKVNDMRYDRLQSRVAIGNALAADALHKALQKACQACLQHDLAKIEKMIELVHAADLLSYGNYMPEVKQCIAKCLQFELHFRSTFELPTDAGIWTIKTEARVKLRLNEEGVGTYELHRYAYLQGSGRWEITDIIFPTLTPAVLSAAPKAGVMVIPIYMLKMYKQRTVWVPGTGPVTSSVLDPSATMYLKADSVVPSENATLTIPGIYSLPMADVFAPAFAAMHVNELVSSDPIAPPGWLPSFVMTGWTGPGGDDIIFTKVYIQKLDESVENTLIELHHTPGQ